MAIYHSSFGTPEKIIPTFLNKINTEKNYDTVTKIKAILFKETNRGCRLSIPLKNEKIYGFGLQLKSFLHNGKMRHIKPNADPNADNGESHAPVPFFVTDEGYGIYIDTLRHLSFYCNRKVPGGKANKSNFVHTNTESLYAVRDYDYSEMVVDIPVAKGIDVYLFTGESILDIVSQYNIFSGGGCMPPLWGLGNFYRCCATFDQSQILDFANQFNKDKMPITVIGLEPGWHTHAYSCTYVWNKERYPEHKKMLDVLKEMGYHVNLWEHAFVHPDSPLYDELIKYSGDYVVWEGLVPDFSIEDASKKFAAYHKNIIDEGICGFKLDECDDSDITGGWSFPIATEFPSGMDGEQYHSMFGQLYSKTIESAFDNRRTYGLVRNLGSLAAPLPFVLYSDLYNHKDFLNGVVNSGFSGLLWSPEVREAVSKEDLIRRVQLTVFSAQSQINAWYLKDMPWNNWNAIEDIRKLLELRIALIPYLYEAFYKYKTVGVPPIRALVCDYTNDEKAKNIDNEFLFGDSIIVAPLISGEKSRNVYLPKNEWYDFFSGEKIESGEFTVETKGIPVYVKGGTILPLANSVERIDKNTVFDITLHHYGDTESSKCRLIEDDGENIKTNYREIFVDKTSTELDSFRYNIVGHKTFI